MGDQHVKLLELCRVDSPVVLGCGQPLQQRARVISVEVLAVAPAVHCGQRVHGLLNLKGQSRAGAASRWAPGDPEGLRRMACWDTRAAGRPR